MRISDTNKQEEVVFEPLEVKVTYSFEDAYRRFKSLVQKEKVVSDVKQRQAYEKPSVKKRRREREATERRLMAEAREQQIASGEWEKRQRRKQEKRQKKMEEAAKRQNNTGTNNV